MNKIKMDLESSKRDFADAAIKRTMTVALLVCCVLQQAVNAQDTSSKPSTPSIEQRFANPPPSARPETYWMWMNGSITREGITADLEAMKAVGIGGAHIFNIGPSNAGQAPIRQVRFMSQEWQDLFLHAVREADRLGLNIGMNNCPGWSSAGGPWIDGKHSMQALTFSRTEVEGGSKQTIELSEPWSQCDWYQDVAVLAFPSAKGMVELTPKVTASSSIDGNQLMDGRLDTQVALTDAQDGQKRFLQLTFDTAVTVNGFWFRDFGSPHASRGGVFEVSSDGKAFKAVGRFRYKHFALRHKGDLIYETFNPVRGTHFRITFDEARGGPYRIGELDLIMAPTLKGLLHKAGYLTPHGWSEVKYDWAGISSGGPALPLKQVVELTDKMDAQGRVTWQVPPGRWTVLRVGHTSNGISPRPLPNAGWSGHSYRPDTIPDDGVSHSLESDKYSKAATILQYESFIGKLARRCGSLAGKALKTVAVDSWEVGSQNWTGRLPKEFKQRRGYALTPYLPLLLTGTVVESVEHSERFLEDYRRTLQELLIENFFKTFQELAHRDGLKWQMENYHSMYSDTLDVMEYIDAPTATFWSKHHSPNTKFNQLWTALHSESGSQVYGAPIVPAEAFTSIGTYTQSPKMLKPLGDLYFSGGVNQMVFHTFAHIPWENRKPGAVWSVGLHMDRGNTWWPEATGWVRYMHRCQALLQQGRGVGRIVVVMPRYKPASFSQVQKTYQKLKGQLPEGIGHIYCSQAALVDEARLDNGSIRFPLGEGYRMVLLPDTDTSSPELLQKVEELLKAGVAVYSTRRPRRAQGADPDKKRSTTIRRMADALWGDIDGKQVTHRRVGKGLLMQGMRLDKAIKLAGIKPDFTFANANGTPVANDPKMLGLASINFIHRRTEDADFYFVANYSAEPHRLIGRFAITGRAPQRWDPITGRMKQLAAWREVDGATELPLNLGPTESAFIVFPRGDQAGKADPVISLTRNSNELFPAFPGKKTKAAEKIGDWELTKSDQGALELETAMAGTFTATTVAGKRFAVTAPTLPKPVGITGPWQVDFEPGLGAPATATFPKLISWSDHSDKGIRYFSGHATYNTTFHVPPAFLRDGQRFRLDLGNVEVAATVTVNGKDMGILWQAPYAVDVTDALKAGKNVLAVRVVNLWPNRLIGDLRLPREKRVAFTVSKLPYKPDSKLLPSGLLGPVKLRVESVLPFQQKTMTKE